MSTKLCTLLVAALAAVSFPVTAAAAETFDAARQFSLAANPNGAWSYLTAADAVAAPAPLSNKNTGALEPRAGAVSYWNTGAGSWEGYHGVFANLTGAPVTVSAGLVLEPGALVMHPSSRGAHAVLRFTAAVAGDYAIDAAFTAIDAQARRTNVLVRAAGAELHRKDLQGAGASTAYRGSVRLAAGQTVELLVGNGGDGFADDAVRVSATIVRQDPRPTFAGWYRLKTVFQGPDKCLEGNQAASPVKQGAAFMDRCQNVSGQLWQLVPEGEYFRLKTRFQGANKCLEGNEAGSPVKGGAAFMDDCKNVSGQLWKVVPEGATFRLKTMFQGDDRCLEGNQAASPVKQGAAFMDRCQNVSGQLWQILPQ